MHHYKVAPRREYLRQEAQRVSDSPSLAEKFPALKSLSVVLACFGPEGVRKMSEIKYKLNLANAKSLFRFGCPNTECIKGNFDLTEGLATAIAEHRQKVSGEVCCQGWRSTAAIGKTLCHHILRYRLSLAY